MLEMLFHYFFEKKRIFALENEDIACPGAGMAILTR